MVKILGLIDLFAAVIILLIGSKIQVHILVLIFVVACLFIKACISILNIGGLTDLAIAILILLSIFMIIPWPLLLIGLIIISVKGLISLFS